MSQTLYRFAYNGEISFTTPTSDTGVKRARLGSFRLGTQTVLGMYAFPEFVQGPTYTSWTPVNSSLNFSISSVVSRGGYGENGILYLEKEEPLNAVSSLYNKYFNTDADVWTQDTYIYTNLGVTSSNNTEYLQGPSLTATWTPVNSSLNFNISSVVSRGGFGEQGALFLKGYVQSSADGHVYLRRGTVKGVSSVVHSISATLAGAGTCTATAYMKRNLAATTLSGVGSVYCTMLPVEYISATLTGVGSVTASISQNHRESASLAGVGSITATASIIHYTSASLAGVGTVSSSAIRYNDVDGFYETGATINGVNVKLIQRFTDNQYLDGTNDLSIKSLTPWGQHRESPSMLGYNFSYLTKWLDDGFKYRYVGDDQQFTEFVLWDIATDLTQESTFSGTLSGETLRNSTMSTVDLRRFYGVYHPFVLAATGWEGDGKTAITIGATAEWNGNLDIGTSTACSFTAVKVKQTGFECDGHTNVAWGSSLYATTGWEGDGTTSMSINGDAEYNIQFHMDGATSCSFTGSQSFAGFIECDGATDVEYTCHFIGAGYIDCAGNTACSITAHQAYAGFFSWLGKTSLAITATQAYAAAIYMQGIGTCNFEAFRQVYGYFECDGATNCTFEVATAQLGYWEGDGSTTMSIVGSFLPSVEIVCTGVGDLFFYAQKGIFQGFTANGNTSVAILAHVNWAGFPQWYTGIGTEVYIVPHREVTDGFECDGETLMMINPAQNQYGNVIFLPNTTLSAIGSYEYDDTVDLTSTSSTVINSHDYVLGSQYLWGIIFNNTDFGSPNFVSLFSSYFTTSGIKSTSQGGPNFLGRMNVKSAFGFSRAAENFLYQPAQEFLREEWVRFPFFVSEAIDITQISNSVAFTADGITAQGGDGVLGRDKEEYVLFSVLTNARLTQATLEILATGNPYVRTTQVNYEMLWIPASYARCTQVVEEVLYLANLAAIQQAAVETLAGGNGGEALLQQAAIELLYSIKAAVLMTQATLEALQGPDNPSVRMTQTTMEVLSLNQIAQYAAANIQQVAAAALHNANPNAQLQQVAIEELFNNAGFARLQQVAIEEIGNGNSDAVVNAVAVAELNNSTTMHGCVQQVAVEMLVRPGFDGTVGSLINNPHYHA